MKPRLAIAFALLSLLLAPVLACHAESGRRDLSIDDIAGSSDADDTNLKWWAGGRRGASDSTPSASDRETSGSKPSDKAVKTRDVREIRRGRDAELDSLFSEYDQRAREAAGSPDGSVDVSNPEYQQVQKEYFEKRSKIEKKYKELDAGRGQELERIKKKYKGKIRSTGSNPDTVQSDIDVTADSRESARELADEWRAAGDDVRYDPETGTYQNASKEGVIWEPPTEQQKAARQASAEAYDKPGGKHDAGVRDVDAVPDAAGAHADHRKKFKSAAKKGDLRTQGKTLSKAAKATGHTSTVAEQADVMRAGGSTDDAGITQLGESPEVREKKIAEWEQKADVEMDAIEPKARKKSEVQQKTRRDLAERVRKNTPQHDDWNTADAIEGRADKVDASHADGTPEAAGRKPRAEVPDGPAGKGHVGEAGKKVDGMAKKPGLFSPKSRVGQALDGVGHVDTTVMVVGTGTKVAKGIQKGDASEVVEAGLGKDTVDRHRQSEGLEKDTDAMDAADRKVVPSELKAKLMRKGATREEAEKAVESRARGDREGWDQIVSDVKSRNIADTKQRPLEVGPDLDMKDDWGSRMWEGGKQTIEYADVVYGSPIAKTKASIKERDKLDSEDRQDTQGGVQQTVDNKVIARMVRAGIPVDEARQAVDERKAGDSSRFDAIRQELQTKGTDFKGAGDGGLETRDLTSSYEVGDYVEGAVENVKDEFRNRAAVLQEPFNMVAEHGEKKNLDNMKNEEMVAGRYRTLRQAGASPDEALEAARSYYEKGDVSGIRRIAKAYKQRQKDAEAKKAAEMQKAEDGSVQREPAEVDPMSRLRQAMLQRKAEEGLLPDDGKDLVDGLWADSETSKETGGDTPEYDMSSPFDAVGQSRNDIGEHQTYSSHMMALKGSAEIKRESDGKQMHIRDKGGSAISKTRSAHQDTSAADAFAQNLSKSLDAGLQKAGEAAGSAAFEGAKRGLAGDKRKGDGTEVASTLPGQLPAGAQVGATQPGTSDPSSKPKKKKKKKSSGKGKGDSGGKRSSGSEQGPTYETIRCGECGYSMKFKSGTRPPSRCPQCSAGKDRAQVECSDCGRTWTIPAGSMPGPCSSCSAKEK